jgi:hypothetical protein
LPNNINTIPRALSTAKLAILTTDLFLIITLSMKKVPKDIFFRDTIKNAKLGSLLSSSLYCRLRNCT